MVANIAEHLNAASLADDRTTNALHARMEKPRPGDLVIDIYSADWDPRRFGRLSRIEQIDDKTMWVIAPLHAPGTECAWDSKYYEFIALPADVRDRQWVPD